MKNRVRTPGQQLYAKTQKGKCARASYCNQKWERTEDRFQQSIYRELCQISITIEGGEFWNSSLNQRTKYWSYASYFIDALKLALPPHRIQSASFDRKRAQHLRFELFDSSICYKVPSGDPHAALSPPNPLLTRSQMSSVSPSGQFGLMKRDRSSHFVTASIVPGGGGKGLRAPIREREFIPPRTGSIVPGGAGRG
jgi:hypothetical protein